MSWRVLDLGECHRAMLHYICRMRLLLHLERHSNIWTLHRVLMLDWLMGVPDRVAILVYGESAFISRTVVSIGICDMLAVWIHWARVD